MPETLDGVIERITFHNLDNGYCVLRVTARGQREPVTVVGHSQQVVAGEYLTATGDWVADRTHGRQFKADEIKTTPPHTAEGIRKYLGSGLVKGIGPRLAERIVEIFKDRTLDVIDQSPSFLSQVRGIGPRLIEKIRASWREQRTVRSITVFLASYGIGTARAARIFKAYGEAAIEMVKSNPYRLCADIWGIGFATADELALKLGVPRDSPHRAQAAVRHVLAEAHLDGHVGYPEELLRHDAATLTGIEPAGIDEAIDRLLGADEIARDAGPPEAARRGEPGELVYLKPMLLAEVGVAAALAALARGPHPLPAVNADAAIGWAEQKMGIAFAGSQRAAVKEALARKLLVLTGGPGTGKTTIVRAIIEIFIAKSLRVLLAAPTGRAAKRLAESTGREAKTIHRLLEFDPAAGGFRRHADHPLDVDLLVIDEASMLDLALMHRLIQAVPPWASAVFVGDVDQLPSVGAGAVLADMIESKAIPVARLSEVHRQAGASWIVRAAHAVNRGEFPESAPGGQGDFYFIEADEPEAIIGIVKQMVVERIPRKFALDSVRDVQVITPQVKTVLGVANLNRELQAVLNGGAGGEEVRRYEAVLRRGDKVMQVQNNYTREVFNGDIGRVARIDAEDQQVTVEFDGRPVHYDYGDLDELQLAYAITVHKSQGAEYPVVIVPVHTQHYTMLQRNLLYTAITRGRKLVALVGSRKALWRAVLNAETSRRFSLLQWRIRAAIDAGRVT